MTELVSAPSAPSCAGYEAGGRDSEAGPAPILTDATLRLWKAFAPLPPQQRRWALTGGVVERAQAGGRHVGAGDVVVVTSGCLATYAAGSELAAEILGPGDVVATGAARTVSGQWITDGELYRVARTDWLSRAGVEGLTHLLNAADDTRSLMERRLFCAVRHLATARVADLFLSVHEAAPGSNILLSQERLGGMLGLRRTTVNGSCRALERSGASRTRRGTVRVMDAAILAASACGCRKASGLQNPGVGAG